MSNLHAFAVLIVNPVAGQEDPREQRETFHRIAGELGVAIEIRETTPDRDAGILASEAAGQQPTRIVVVGGDGSVTASAGALAGTGIPLGVVPTGTANLLALNAGIPSNTEEALRLALTGEPRPFDLGRVGDTPFMVVAGIGADAHAVREANREAKNRLGFLAYIVAAAKSLRRPRVSFDLDLDGRPIRRQARSVMVANVGSLPAAELVSGASPEDGLLDVAIVRARTLLDALAIPVQALAGRAGGDHRLEILRASRVTVRTRIPQPVQYDGEEAEEADHLEVRVEPGAVLLVHPPPSDQPATLIHKKFPVWIPLAFVAVGVFYFLRRRKA